MQQIQFIKQKLEISQFPEIKTRELGILRAPQIILSFLVVTFVFNLIGFYSLTYLFLGFVLPGICRYKDIKIFNYWECLAFLLFFRTFSDAFASIDVFILSIQGLLLVLLWHPNFRFGQKIIEWVKSYKEKGHIDKGINEIKKIL